MKRGLSWTSFDSKEQLLRHMESRDPRPTIIGRDAESPSRFCSLKVESESGFIELGVILSFHGIDPKATLFESKQRLLIGHDSRLTWFDFPSKQVVSSHEMDGVFFEFVSLDARDETLVLHELGVVRVDAVGVRWSYRSEITSKVEINARGAVVLTLMGRKRPILLNVDTGGEL